MNKDQAWDLLFLFRDLGFIEIVPFQGIKIGYVKNSPQTKFNSAQLSRQHI
jgi:hypothetical protein